MGRREMMHKIVKVTMTVMPHFSQGSLRYGRNHVWRVFGKITTTLVGLNDGNYCKFSNQVRMSMHEPYMTQYCSKFQLR